MRLPGQVFVPDKHTFPWLIQGGAGEGCLDSPPDGPGVAEEEVLGELNPREHLPVPLLIFAGDLLPQ